MQLVEILQNVNSRETFLEFVSALTEDKKNSGKSWESSSIEDCLDSAKSWLEDSKREDVSWKLMAEFLYCGKIYE